MVFVTELQNRKIMTKGAQSHVIRKLQEKAGATKENNKLSVEIKGIFNNERHYASSLRKA